MIAVSYPSLFEVRPAAKIESWGELVAMLSDHRENTDKERAALWSPVSLQTGGTRKNASVTAVNALVLDVDGGTAWRDLRPRLSGWDWIAYSTHSHRQGAERFHAVVRLPEPIKGEEWAARYDGLKGLFGAGDSLRAPCHSYFVPQHQPGAEWFVEVGQKEVAR
jgi:hypothetical protein